MKARYSYPIYPKTHQLESLAKAMGCIVTEEHYFIFPPKEDPHVPWRDEFWTRVNGLRE